MRALVKTQAGPGLSLTDVPEPEIGINDVLIRVRKTGICGTDLHIESWDPWAAKTILAPLVVGHEFVGEVVEVGSNVADFHPGDLVSGEGHVVCGRCRHCLAGRRHLCAHTIGLGVGRDGAFAEYVALPMANVWHHWPGIDEEVAAIFDPFGNAVHTALAFPVLGEDVLVSGAGPIGLMQAVMDQVVPYIHDRKQFGQSIGEFQLIQGKVADMYTVLQAARAFCYTVGKNLDRLGAEHVRQVRKDCAAVILWCAEKATWMAGEGIQIFGGNGYINDYPLGRLWRDAKLYEIGAGTSEIRRMLIGRELFDETR